MKKQAPQFTSSALQVNLERTAATVEIPLRYQVLLNIAEGHFGVSKRTQDLLTEMNHPFVNWEHVLKQLRTLSMGDFYEFNGHEKGLKALETLIGIYLEILTSPADEETRETAVRFLFDFLNLVLSKSNGMLPRNLTLFSALIDSLVELSDREEFIFRKCSTYGKKLIQTARDLSLSLDEEGWKTFLHNVFRSTYLFWLDQSDPQDWFNRSGEEATAIFSYDTLVRPLTHHSISDLVKKLEAIPFQATQGAQSGTASYLDLPDYLQIMEGYLLVADALEKSEAYAGREYIVKLDFLFHIINVPALADIHGRALIEINRCLALVFREEKTEDLNGFVQNVFHLLRKCSSCTQYQSTVLSCVITVSKEVFRLNHHPLVDTLIEELILFGFQHPHLAGSTTEWQIRVNPAHIENIRTWLEIISFKPRWTKRLLSALIINLKLGGVFVRDTDLLQKNISALLNTDIEPAYNLIKQLLRLFPIYFSEIGAEGELREISTEVDELSFRQDLVIHFLRKQSHVESNSLMVPFLENAFRFWALEDKTHIRDHLPDEVYEQIAQNSEDAKGLRVIFETLLERVGKDPKGFLEWDASRVNKEMQTLPATPEKDRKRAALLIRFYQLLYQKYHPRHIEVIKTLETSFLFDPQKVQALKRSLQEKKQDKSLAIILEFLAQLKEKILSPEKTEYVENIYRKRHIAAGIPSMYGTYREEKFEAVGLSLRLESLATVLFEELVQSLNLNFITKSTLMRIHQYLWLYVKALDIEGIAIEGLTAKMKYVSHALEIKQFSIDQYIDIFQFISKGIQDIIRDYHIDAHRPNLPIIIGQLIEEDILSPGKTANHSGEEEIYFQTSEGFFRAAISSAFGLQVLDNFINSIIHTLQAEKEKFKDNKQILTLVMSYDPEMTITPLYRRSKRLDNQLLIGNKGYYLKELASMNFPVPPGFILTTEVFRRLEGLMGYQHIFEDLMARVAKEIRRLEKMVGRKFGDPRNPLLLSVRSGATLSLPGMMQSILNVGINEKIAEGLSRKPDYAWAAWDSFRRFLQSYGMLRGLDRNFFDGIIDRFKQQFRVDRKIQFAPDQMKEVALAYRQALEEKAIKVLDQPWDQLQDAILQVITSWNSEQARIYRHQVNLSDEWGTAVIVQTMIFGNLNDQSGSGVIFTRDPKELAPGINLYGDFIFGVQGDDIVSGLVSTYPISERQRQNERKDTTISLEANFPNIYKELVRLSEHLIYDKRFNHQEIEFTFEKTAPEGLFILQTRDMVQRETGKLKIFKETDKLKESLLGTGIGVNGGALSGRAVYSEEEIRQYREQEPGTPLILIRPDSVPDDVGILLQVEGLLTAKGGSTSHAAVTIPQLDKVGVVGFTKLSVYETKGYSTVDGRTIRGGDFISIDGWSGAVYEGRHEEEARESQRVTL
ncbi:MAG: PEP/pyruvate-binding domain-containing protein [Thermodesulfobacteriota bacterium]